MSRARFLILAVVVIAGGVALQLPSLGIGFFADDYVHQAVLEGQMPPGAPLAPWDLYDFGRADDWRDESGLLTPIWWASDEWQVRFLRPVTSVSIWLDHCLWGDQARGYHLTSLAWYAVTLGLALALLRCLGLARPAALLAVALMACTNGATLPVGWIANRNTLLATTATLGAMLALLRLGPRRGLPVALALAAVAVGCKESGVVAFAMIAAWLGLRGLGDLAAPGAPAGDPGSRPGRAELRNAAVALGAAAAYVALIALAGVGTRSLFYATPWHEPAAYLANLWVLLTAGLLRLVVPISLDLATMVPQARQVLPVVGLVLAWPLAVVVWRRVGSHPAAGMLGLWTVVSLLVEGSAPSSDRLIFQAAFGSAGLLALLIHRALDEVTRTRSRQLLAWTLLVLAGPVSAVGTLIQGTAIAAISRSLRRQVLAVDVGPPHQGVIDAVLLQAGDPMLPFVLGPTWWGETGRTDVRFTILQMDRRGLVWTRVDERTMVLRSTGTPLLTGLFESVYRSDRQPPQPGELLRSTILAVEPLQDEGDGLRSIRVRLDRSLDDPGLRFLAPGEGGRLVPLEPPAPGETLVLPEAESTMLWLP
jgi:hypothetical protein